MLSRLRSEEGSTCAWSAGWLGVQADYLQTKAFNSTQHDPRISTGIVLRF
jgi:hypothetical protein